MEAQGTNALLAAQHRMLDGDEVAFVLQNAATLQQHHAGFRTRPLQGTRPYEVYLEASRVVRHSLRGGQFTRNLSLPVIVLCRSFLTDCL